MASLQNPYILPCGHGRRKQNILLLADVSLWHGLTIFGGFSIKITRFAEAMETERMSTVLIPENIAYLVVHCADTPDDEALDAQAIHDMHLGFGWHGVGYHWVICRDGTLQAGRPEYWVGAHVKGHNEISLGVCLIGHQNFTDAQMQTLESLLVRWRMEYPDAEICGHCDFDYTEKTCPNFDVATWCVDRRILAKTGVKAKTKAN